MTFARFFLGFVTAFVALFPVLNPVGTAFILNRFISHLNPHYHRRAVRHIIVNSLSLALGSLILGHFILMLFHLAIPAIQLGGGLLICYMAWGWLKDEGESEVKPGKETKGAAKATPATEFSRIERKLFYPMSFPITIEAGTMAVIFTLMASVKMDDTLGHIIEGYAAIALAIVAICAILYIMLATGHRITRRLGVAGELIVNKIIAFLTLCVGLQIMIEGVGAIFHVTVL